MGDDDQRLAAGRAGAGQPGDALDVEVVGRLVEDEQVVLADQQLGQRDPAPLAAGQRADDGVEHRVEVRREPPNRPVSTSRIRASPAHSWSARSPTTSSRTVAAGSRSSCWASTRDPQPAGVRDAAGVRRLAPGQHPQQRRLAVAVAPDDADAVALADAERDAVEQGAGAVAPC